MGRGLGERGRRADRGSPRQARGVSLLPRDHRAVAPRLFSSVCGGKKRICELQYLVRGLPGHPLHPSFTDATIGIYTFATLAALTDVLSVTNTAGAQGWWLALILGLATTVLSGWLGGAIVYVHGMRVLSLVEEPAGRAVAPAAHPEKQKAAEG